jgi:adenylosuccinate lyase
MLALVDKGMDKDEAYRLVQGVAMRAWDEGGDFRQMIAKEPAVAERLAPDELAACFDYERHLKRVEVAYQRLGL